MFVTTTSASLDQPPAKIKYMAHKVKVRSKVRKANKVKLKMPMPETQEIISNNTSSEIRWKGFKVSIKNSEQVNQCIDALHSEKKQNHSFKNSHTRPMKTIIFGRVG